MQSKLLLALTILTFALICNDSKYTIFAQTDSLPVVETLGLPIDPNSTGSVTSNWKGYSIHNSDLSSSSTCYKDKNGGTIYKDVAFHSGEDWRTNPYTEVMAVADGEVVHVQYGHYPGWVIITKHRLRDNSTVYFSYGHLATALDGYAPLVVKGDTVTKGQVIGYVYDWGNNTHLHWEVRTFENGDFCGRNEKAGPGYTWPNHPDTPLKEHPDMVEQHPDFETGDLSVGYSDPRKFIQFYNGNLGHVRLFEHSYYRGAEQPYAEISTVEPVAQYNVLLNQNDTASSLAMPKNWTVRLHEDTNWRGNFTDFYKSDVNFSNDQLSNGSSLDNTTSSLTVYRIGGCYLPPSTSNAISEKHYFDDCGPTSTPGPVPTYTPIPPSANIEIVNINSPSTINPNQSFIPEVTVRLLNGQQLLESRGDMLRHYGGTNYSTFPHIGVIGSASSGQTYTFRFYDGYPFVAPSANGDYESVWRVWADGQWIGPEIPIRFTVGSQATPTPDWLLSHAEFCEIPRVQCSLDANISNIAKRAFRIRINDWTCGEISGGTTYLLCHWDAVNYPNGNYEIHYELDPPGSEGSPWANPLRYTHNFELGGSAEGLALCDGDNGVYIRQSDRCVRLTQSNRDIAPLGFSGQNVEFSVTGPYQAWLYNAGDFKGTVWVVASEEARTMSYVNSVKLIDNPDAPPPLPADSYACDSNTALLFHFDEAPGLPVSACPPNGSATSNTAVRTTGKWGNALRYENSASQKTELGSYNPCALTVDFWYRRLDTGGVHVLARQENKWELSSDGNRVNLEVWGKYGSERAYGWKEINDSSWHYIMFIYDCASSNPLSQLYIDNVLVGEIITNEQWHLNVAPILLDGRNGQHAIHGEIDEFRVSNVVRSITDLGPVLIPATPTPIPTDTPVPTSTPTPLPTATPVPTATPYPDSLVLVQSVVATGNSGTQMHSTSYRLVGTAGSVALPANATMLTSANFTHKPGFLAGQTRVITSASQSQQAAYPGDVGNSVEDKRIYLPLISR